MPKNGFVTFFIDGLLSQLIEVTYIAPFTMTFLLVIRFEFVFSNIQIRNLIKAFKTKCWVLIRWLSKWFCTRDKLAWRRKSENSKIKIDSQPKNHIGNIKIYVTWEMGMFRIEIVVIDHHLQIEQQLKMVSVVLRTRNENVMILINELFKIEWMGNWKRYFLK